MSRKSEVQKSLIQYQLNVFWQCKNSLLAHCSAEPFLQENIFHLFIESLRLIKRCNIASLPKLCLFLFILKNIQHSKKEMLKYPALHRKCVSTGYSTSASPAAVRKVLSSSLDSLTMCWVQFMQRTRHRKVPLCIGNKCATTNTASKTCNHHIESICS